MKNIIDLTDVIYLPAPKDISHLLEGIPEGDWVVLTSDEERLLAYGPNLDEAVQKARDAGEDDPYITRAFRSDVSFLL
jgi:hypothetical protein